MKTFFGHSLAVLGPVVATLLGNVAADTGVAGPAGPLGKEDSMAVYTVSSATELKAALGAASGGDVVELAAGDYGNVSLSGLNYDSEVTVISADTDDPAVFNTLAITQSSNVIFDSLFIDMTPTENTVEWSSAFRATQDVANITLRNSKVEGGDSIAGVPADSDPGEQGPKGIIGEPIGRAITLGGRNLVIENNDISHFRAGILLGGVGNSIIDNEIYDFRTVPVAGDGWDLTIDGNFFHDANPWKLGGKGDHGDYVHLWTAPGVKPMSNITITNNVFSDENGRDLLGIYLDDNGNGVGFKNVVVEDNVIYSDASQIVRFENVSGASVSRNTFLNDDGVEKNGSQLRLIDGTENVRLEDNIVSTFFSEAAKESLADRGFVFNNNLDVNYDDPTAENYIGRIFSDSRLEGSSLWEKVVVPGSVADGLGSALMHLADSPARLTPVFEVEKAEGEGQELVLRADLSRGPDGAVTDADARFVWDFGDGSGATGQVVRHAYADAGRYDATLTVVMPDGTTAKAVSEVAIMGEDVLSYDPRTGLFDAEGYGEETAIADSDKASVALEGGHGVDLGGSGQQLAIGQQHLSRLFGADSFDLSMTLRADTLGSTGEVARVHGNFVLSIAPRGEVNMLLYADSEGANLTTTGVTVNDGADHDIRVSFDGEARSLEIHVDGELAGATEIAGPMRSDYPRPLVFGNPWGHENFDGTLTAFDLETGNQDFPDYEGDAGLIPDDSVPVDEIPLPEPREDVPTQPEAPDDPVTIDPGGVYLGPDGSDEGSGDTPVDEGGTQDRTDAPADDPQIQPEEPDDPVTIDPGGVYLGPDGSDGGSGDTPIDEGGTQDRTDAPESDPPAEPEGPVYRADIASLDDTQGTARLEGSAQVLQSSDGVARLALEGGKDHVDLGRMEALETSQQLNIKLDFQRSGAEAGMERIVWNEDRVGIAVNDDSLLVFLANNDRPFHRAFDIGDAGLDDTGTHTLSVAADAEADRLQVVLDGNVVLDELGSDLDFAGAGGGSEWTIGSARGPSYQGSVSEFELDDQAVFVDDATAVA